ncbi:MAG: head GIN domain-containing protein [Myxococcaceae bacterium]
MKTVVARRAVMHAWLPRAALVAASLVVLPVRADTVKRSVQGFTRVELHVPLDVTIRPGKAFSLGLDLRDSELASKISTEVHGDTLVITTTDHSLRLRGKNSMALTMPDLRGVSITGSGNVEVQGFERNGDVALSISGSGDITYSGKSSAMTVSIAGSGNVSLAGSTGSLSVAIEGSGDLKGESFTAKNASVEVDGSGDAALHIAGGAVQFAVNGSGDIRWSGEASVVSAVTRGSGSIQKSH